MNATDALLTVDDAAAFLRVSRRTVYQLIADGELRPIKVRRLNRFTQAMLLADDTGANVEVIASRDGQADETIATATPVEPDTHSTATTFIAEQDGQPEFDDI